MNIIYRIQQILKVKKHEILLFTPPGRGLKSTVVNQTCYSFKKINIFFQYLNSLHY